MKTDKVYMLVTNDRYELPVAVANTASELADTLGTSMSYICNCISKDTVTKKFDIKGNKVIKVEFRSD